MRIGCLLSVREKATRLPKKVLLNVAGRPLTVFLLERLKMAKEIDKVIVSTSTHPDDRILADLAKTAGYDYFQGSEEDKLHRYYHTAMAFGLDAVVIVDGDDPFCFPEAVDMVAVELRQGSSDCVYVTGLPVGAAATGLTTAALSKVLAIKDENDTEVWGGYFIGSSLFQSKEICVTDPELNHPRIRLTVDYQEDYDLVTEVIDKLGGRANFSSYELMDLLVNRCPELANLNAIAQIRYEKHLERATPVRLKKQVD